MNDLIFAWIIKISFHREQKKYLENELTCRKKKSLVNGMRDEIIESVDVDIVLMFCWIQLTEAVSKYGWSSFMLARNTFNNNLDAYYSQRR